MPSSINANAIDAAYPVAGVDNDTEGFRTNFNYIKLGLSTAASEITALQAATAGLQLSEIDGGSSFNNKFISNAVLKKNVYSVQDSVAIVLNDIVTIDLDNADHQHFLLNTETSYSFSFQTESIPDENSRRVIIELSSADTTTRTVTFTEAGAFEILKSANFPTTITFNDATSRVLIEAITRKVGNTKTVFLNYIGIFQ